MEKYIKIQEEEFRAPDYPSLIIKENAYFYSYPIVRQIERSKTLSDIWVYGKNVDSNNIYLSKTKIEDYYSL